MLKSYFPLLTALLFAVFQLSAQNPLVPLVVDSSHYHYTDPNTGEEQFQSYAYYTYDGEGLPLSDLFISAFAGSNTYYRYDYLYNAEQQLTNSTSFRSLTSANGPWENWLKDDYTYDAQGRNNFYIGQFGNTSGGWDNYYQETFWFDDATPADSSLYELWNGMAWGNNHRRFNYYFANGDLKQHHEDNWNTNSLVWENYSDDAYTYYPDGKVLTQTSISYYNNQQSILQKDSILYLADGRIDSVFAFTQTSFSNVYDFIRKYQYDGNGNLIYIDIVTKVAGTNDWVSSTSETYAPGDGYFSNDYTYENQAVYNTSNDVYDIAWDISRHYSDLGGGQVLSVEIRRQRNGTALVTQIVDSVWYHIGIVNTGSPAAPRQADCQFANPFRSGNSIVCHAPDQSSLMNIRITDMTGKVVAQGQVMPGDAWRPHADWPAGTYFLSAWQKGQFLGSCKFVKPTF